MGPGAKMMAGWRSLLAAERPLSNGSVVGAGIRVDERNQPTYAIGFVADNTYAWLPRMHVAKFNEVLPVPKGSAQGLEDRFAVSVLSNGKPIYEGGTPSIYSADVQLLPAMGGFVVRASTALTAVPSILGSEVPKPHLPKFAGLMLLASVLIFVVLILAKRESELVQIRADFVSGVSHELRTPLAQIRMFTETLLLGRVRNDAERKRSLEIIDQEAKRLTALVDNVLHLSRAERGAVRLAPAAMPLAPAVREVIETFSQLPRSRGVEFRGELEDRLIASVDPNAFRQILLNLLDNAVKYGPTGQRVNVGLAMFEEHARLWVDDEGPGIPIRERDRVFEPFYRASPHVDSKVVGTGIGLAVVRELAGLLGGRVWAEDAPGGGARIVVEFPEAYLRAAEATGDWAVA
jgi:signal transduction histidine kinase